MVPKDVLPSYYGFYPGVRNDSIIITFTINELGYIPHFNGPKVQPITNTLNSK